MIILPGQADGLAPGGRSLADLGIGLAIAADLDQAIRGARRHPAPVSGTAARTLINKKRKDTGLVLAPLVPVCYI